MIAAGLCLMGGCFAQDSQGEVVNTYWPTHAVRIEKKTLILKDYDLPMPFWVEGVRAGGRLENVVNLGNAGNILNWGEWANPQGIDLADVLYLGLKGGNSSVVGPNVYSVCRKAGDRYGAITNLSIESGANPVLFIEGRAEGDLMQLNSELGAASEHVADFPAENKGGKWRVRIKADSVQCDVVAFWWMNEERYQRYWMVQPMRSEDGGNAFFVHGYDILTEV